MFRLLLPRREFLHARGVTRSVLRLAALLPVLGCPSEAPPVSVDDGTDTGTSSSTSGSSTSGDPTSTTSSSGTTSTDGDATDVGSESSESTGSAFACVDTSLGSTLGLALAVAELDPTQPSRFETGCGNTDAPELAFAWTAPRRDFYVFDTMGSEFDTLLAVMEASCDAPAEHACNDDADGVLYSQIVQELDAGTEVFVLVESPVGESGVATVNVQAATCPTADVSTATFPRTVSNVGGSRMFDSPCAPEGTGLERTLRYTADEAGLYRFRVDSSDFTPVLTVEDGPVCGSPPLQCNAGKDQVPAEITRALQAGQSVTLIVDSVSGSGEFSLDVQRIADDCPATELTDQVTGTIDGGTRAMSASCAYAGESRDGALREFETVSFLWTSPMPIGTSTMCEIVYTGGFPAVLSLQEGACDGPEVQCSEAAASEEVYTATVSVQDIPPTVFTVTLARSAGELVATYNLDYAIDFNCTAVG